MTQAPSLHALLLQRALQHHRGGQLGEAAALYRQILAQDPRHPAALTLLGTLEAQCRRPDAALPLLEAAVKAEPRNPDATLNLGMLLCETGQSERAIPHLKRAVALRPQHADGHVALGNALGLSGHLSQAEQSYRTALRLMPGHLNARHNLANLLLESERDADALAQYDEVLKRQPRHGPALLGRAKALEAAGDADAAVAGYQRLLEGAPRDATAWNAFGGLLERLHRTAEAVAVLRQAAALPSDHRAEILSNLGSALADLGQDEEAAQAWRQSIALRPDGRAVSKLYDQAKQQCRWDEAERLEPLYRELARAGAPRILPYPLMMAFSTPAEQLAAAVAAAREETPRTAPPSPRGKRRPLLSVGYLSPDFRQHAVAHLVAETLELHDRRRFRVTGLSIGPDDGGTMRGRIAAACDQFIDLATDDDRTAAERIRAAGIDIVVDLAGHTRGARLGILGHRPAPLTVTWLGCPGTSGAAFVDYLLADPVLIAPGEEAFYSEQVVRLPHTYQPNDRRRPRPAAVPARNELGLPESAVVFACFTQASRLNAPLFALWMRILQAVPASVLWLLGDGGVPDRLRAAATAHGIAPERLAFAASLPLEAHLARYAAADIVLDSFPYNAHTTTSDALWMGLPVITLKGETFASRVAASLLRAARLPQLVTHSEAEYLSLAVELANAPERRKGIRAHLAVPPESLPLFDTPTFTGNLERAYAAMWERHLDHRPPTAITLE